MKQLSFLSLTFLLLLISTVSSQNPNMFDFQISCHNQCRACDAINLFNQAGQIISDNLVLTSRIGVYVVVDLTPDPNSFGGANPSTGKFVDPEDGVTRIYPTALRKQLDPNFKFDGPDIIMEFNSNIDGSFWFLGIDTEPIQPDKYDFLEYVLHKLLHGLGIQSYWAQRADDSAGNGLMPYDFLYYDSDGKFSFDAFYETMFDKYIVSMKDGIQIKTYTKSLNDMAGPQGRHYNDANDFYTQLHDKQVQEGKTYTNNMMQFATTPNGLGFLIPDASTNEGEIPSEAILLETTYNPFIGTLSIQHLSYDDFVNTEDFLFVSEQVPGRTLQEKIDANGDAPGGGIGANVRTILEIMGYKSRINPSTKLNPTKLNRPTRHKQKRSMAPKNNR